MTFGRYPTRRFAIAIAASRLTRAVVPISHWGGCWPGSQGPRETAQTRPQRREAQAAAAQPQTAAESRTQAHVARRSRPRVHADLLTVAIRGHFAERMRALSDSHGMSLAKLLKDALLVYEGDIEGGYEPGTSLAD